MLNLKYASNFILILPTFQTINKNLDNWCPIKVVAEEVDVDGGRHQHKFEILSMLQQAFHHPQQEVSVDVSLMHFINNNHIVLFQMRVGSYLPQ